MGSRDARCEIMRTLYEHFQCRDSDIHWGTPSVQSLFETLIVQNFTL